MTTLDLGTFTAPLTDWQQPISCRELLRPSSVAEAVAAAAEQEGAAFIAGGTHLVRFARFGGTLPEVLIWLGALPELTTLEADGPTVRIGAAVVHGRLEGVASQVGLLWAAAREIAGPAVRNLGTVGGNVIIDWDLVPALLASDATVRVVTATGSQAIPLTDFHDEAGTPALPAGAVLADIDVVPSGDRWAYRKIARRKAVSRAIAGVAVRGEAADGQLTTARVAVGGSAFTSRRVPAAEEALVGHPVGAPPPPELGEAVRAALADIEGDIEGPAWYVRDVAHVLAERAAADAFGTQEG